MSWVEVTSDSISFRSERTYGIAKYPIRKQFALVAYTATTIEPVAYFRCEAMALEFAEAFDLNVTDHREVTP